MYAPLKKVLNERVEERIGMTLGQVVDLPLCEIREIVERKYGPMRLWVGVPGSFGREYGASSEEIDRAMCKSLGINPDTNEFENNDSD